MMDTFKKPLEELKDYSDLIESLKKDSGFFAVSASDLWRRKRNEKPDRGRGE